MNAHNDDAERKQNAAASAINVCGNEDGAHRHDSLDHYYGRRVEADRSWTVYHVFTSVPAHIGGKTMIGLSQRVATNGMLSLNRHNEAGRRVGGSLMMTGIRIAPDTTRECLR